VQKSIMQGGPRGTEWDRATRSMLWTQFARNYATRELVSGIVACYRGDPSARRLFDRSELPSKSATDLNRCDDPVAKRLQSGPRPVPTARSAAAVHLFTLNGNVTLVADFR